MLQLDQPDTHTPRPNQTCYLQSKPNLNILTKPNMLHLDQTKPFTPRPKQTCDVQIKPNLCSKCSNQWVSQTRIYQCTTHQLSMSIRTQAQLSMSKRTQALNRSMPNEQAQSQLVCFNTDQLQCRQGHKLLIYQCQTNGHYP